MTDDATVQAAFQSDIQPNRTLLDEGALRSEAEAETGKGSALLGFWDQYPIGTSDEVLEWAKVSLQGAQRTAHGGLAPYGSSPAVSGGHDHDWIAKMPAGKEAETEIFGSDDVEASQQLHMESTWGVEDSSEYGPPSSAPSEAVASRLGVPLEFQRMYVW